MFRKDRIIFQENFMRHNPYSKVRGVPLSICVGKDLANHRYGSPYRLAPHRSWQGL